MAKFTFYDKPSYLDDITKRVSATKRGDRVTIASMKFDIDTPEVKKLVEALVAAAGRGVDVLLAIDAYTFLFYGDAHPGPLFYYKKLPTKLPAVFQHRLDALEKLKAAGGHYVITNYPSRRFKNPFSGRSHIKLAVINDRVYLGGCNLSDANQIDMMAAWDDKPTADWLAAFMNKVARIRNVAVAAKDQDLSREVDKRTTLMIDVGRPDQSLIYEKAWSIMNDAQKSLFMACQYFPNGSTARLLRQAKRGGVDVSIVFNHPSKHGLTHSLIQYPVTWFERLRNPPAFFSGQLPKTQPKLHAKLIASEQAVMIGSHNYVPAGVKWGTAEIALLSRDPKFANAAIQALQKQIK